MANATRNGTVIVTGASRGIGLAIAADLIERGYRVACVSRSGTAVGGGSGHACDMGDEAQIAATIAVVADSGPVIGLVNNAGQYGFVRSAELTTADYEGMMRINATSAMIGRSSTYVRPSNSRCSLPSASSVPAPVGV